MKYSQLIGAIATIALVICCFFPWISIPSHQIIATGFQTSGTNFGKPGLVHVFFSGIMLALFCVQQIWAKRTNVFVGALNIAWAFRNYVVFTTCSMGECPEKHFALFATIVLACLAQLMAFLPKIDLSAKP
jgi:hypothetical protein